jgi:transposase
MDRTPDDISADETASLAGARQRIASLERENELMREEIRLLRAKKFEPTSEKSSTWISGQQLLFNEAEATAEVSRVEPDTGTITYRRKKRVGKREEDLSALFVHRIDYEIPDEQRICPQCGERMHEMDIDIRREIEYIPATIEVIEQATHVYACRSCQQCAENTPIIKASSPEPLIRGSLVSASLLAQVLCDKYVYHLPLYRQEYALHNPGFRLRARRFPTGW